LLDELEVNGDSISMALHIFDAALVAKIEDGKLTGAFVKNYAKDASLPFSATFGESFRFSSDSVATQDYSGKYAVQFINAKNDTTLSVAIFDQKGNQSNWDFPYPHGRLPILARKCSRGQINA